MKITIDVSQMAYAGTGVGRYTHELVKALLTAGGPHQYTLWAGVRKQRPYFEKLAQKEPWNRATWLFSHLSPKLAGIFFNHTSLPFEYFAGPADLIHLSDWTAPHTRGLTVSTVHDLAFVKYPAHVDPLIRRTQAARLTRLIKHQVHLIADSQSTKNDLMEIYQVDPTRITVIYPGLSPEYRVANKTEIERVKTKYQLPNRFILSLGTREPRKNLANLIQATASLPLPLVIGGKYGWGKDIASPAHVQTLGFVKEGDLPALYSAATVFCYPSLYEGFGFPVLEAMACGTPVVTSNVSSLPEVVGEAGILVDPHTPASIKAGIEQAIATREKLIKKGLQQAKLFRWDKTARQMHSLYEKLNSNNH